MVRHWLYYLWYYRMRCLQEHQIAKDRKVGPVDDCFVDNLVAQKQK
jgi:hypothetical protein